LENDVARVDPGDLVANDREAVLRRGHDRLLGGPGDDVLNAPDRRRDVAYADRGDVVRPSCERVVRRG